MSETKHTPGPWRIDQENPTLIYHEEPYKRSNNVRSDIATIIQRDEPQRICEANARLIAAAPALLEACKKAAPLAELWLDDNFRDTEAFNIAIQAISHACKAAIALAEKEA